MMSNVRRFEQLTDAEQAKALATLETIVRSLLASMPAHKGADASRRDKRGMEDQGGKAWRDNGRWN